MYIRHERREISYKGKPENLTEMKKASTMPFSCSLSATFWIFVLFHAFFMAASQANDQTIHRDGDFIIEALLPITRQNGEIFDTFAMASEIIPQTIDDINNSSKILPNITLGYDIINDKSDLNVIMKRAIGIVSKYRPHSICRQEEEFCTTDQYSGPFVDKRIGAVIGPATSSSSVPSASLLGLYNIPQISYSASSSILSEKTRFKSFLRTIPSDTYQAEAIASFVKYFHWNYVFFIGSDDEYGRQGLMSFKMAARKRKVCTTGNVNIPFQRPSDAEKYIKEIITEMKKKTRVRVAVLFMFNHQIAKVLKEVDKQGLRNVTWILSDAVGPGVGNYGINKELLHGAFAIDFVYRSIPEFEEYILNLTVAKAKENPWMLQFLEKTLNCSSASTSGKRPCKHDETLDKYMLNLSNRWSRLINIVNSIKAIAYGLDNLIKCNGRLPSGLCPNTTLPISAKDLYLYIRNASFTGPIGEQVSFDDDGDLITKMYTFRNVLLNRAKNTLEFQIVANWSSLQPECPSFLKSAPGHGLTWNSGQIPSATCSQACQPGEKQVGQSDCCWGCHPCPKGEISNTTGAKSCHKCPNGWYANEKQTDCLKTEIDYVESSDAFSIVIISISGIGMVAIVIIASMFYYVKSTPLIQDSIPVLLTLLLLSISLGLLYAIFQVSLYRTDPSCRFLGAMLLFTVVLVASTLLAKTSTCNSYLQKFTSHYLKSAAEYANLIFIGALLLFELLLVGVWFLTDTPVVNYLKSSQALHIRECNSSWSAGRFIATGFPLLVLSFATAFAFKERDNRKNHHEAKYISFCTISLCILLIAFFPTYRFAQGITTSVVIATTSLVGALAVCGCTILPKVYILVVQPERNVPEEERERSHNTVSSAHTTGSQHQPVFPEPGEELRAPSDVEFMSSASSAPENNVVKDVPVT